MTISTPMFCTDQSYPFEDLRLVLAALASPGVVSPGDMLVSPAAGLQVQIAAGRSFVPQTVAVEGSFYASGAGVYFVVNDAAASPYNTILAPSVNPRVDTIVLRVYDVNEQGLPGSSFARFEWVQGTETSGANLTPGSGGFLAGAAALPVNSLRLSWVLQTVGESSISSGNILNDVAGTLGWMPLALAVGASPLSGSYVPSARRVGDHVEFVGAATGSNLTSWATLPIGMRPAANINGTGSGGSGVPNQADQYLITPAGAITAITGTNFFFFDGVIPFVTSGPSVTP